ncbi:MAG: hypothetical protein HDR20_12430 [Lachnospiraceae bacterium]|nr:hypothetical protein [Lachnospiraceae bacterium]
MNMDVLIFLYSLLVFGMIIAEIVLLQNNKGRYLVTSYKAIEKICYDIVDEDDGTYSVDELIVSINRFYEEYVQEDSKVKKYFPNVVIWLDAIIFRVDCGYSRARILSSCILGLKEARDELERENPFNKCEKYQQDILNDINKLKTDQNSIIISNIVKRTEDEFIRMSRDINKNDRANKISMVIGIIGIIVSIGMAFVKFSTTS